MISSLFNVNPNHAENDDVLLYWQKKIFKYLCIVFLLAGAIPYALGLFHALKLSQWYLAGGFSLVYLLGTGAVFFTAVPFRIRAGTGLAAIYFTGILCFIETGVSGTAQTWFLGFSAFTVMFISLKGGLFTLVLNGGVLFFPGFLSFGGTSFSSPVKGAALNLDRILPALSFTLINTTLVLSLAVLLKALESKTRELRHLTRQTPDILWALDRDLNVSFISDALYSTLGYRREEWIGLPLNRFLNRRDAKNFTTKLNREKTFSIEAGILDKKGTAVPVEISSTRLPDGHRFFQGTIRDITREKKLETEKRDVEQKLEQARKQKELGILTGSVAHDLNNILSGIATYPEVLLMETRLDPAIEKGLKIIKESGQKASAVVSDLLTISRGAAEKEIININALLQRYTRAHDFTKVKAGYPNVNIELITEPELLNIRGSYLHIEKTVMNLVLNAVADVSQKPDGRIVMSTANTFLDTVIPGYESRAPGEYVLLRVADNGSGISRADRKKIFDPFYTKKEMGKSGTGLGLTIVRNTVRDHGGYIDVASGPNGTTFNLMFPATRQEISEKPGSGTLEEIKGSGQMLLVVDDLPDQQHIALSILESLGYKAQAVDNGYDAVEFIRKIPTDLVILDMIMAPSISGLETYRMIKKINPGQKAIIASGYAESEDVLTARHLGAGSFVKKPYTILDMGIAVKEELEK